MPLSAVALRDVRRDEAARLADFMRALFVAAYRHCSTPDNVDAFLAAAYGETQQGAELDDPAQQTFVAERDGEWLGVAQLRLARTTPGEVTLAHGAEVGRLYLAPAAQGAGLGRTMMRELERRALAQGRDGLWLNVWQDAPQAIAFYRREGFAIVGTTGFAVGDDVKTDWRMQKSLSR